MPLIPATWLDEFTVNLTTTGAQGRPRIVHLADGKILVVWDSSDDTGVGAAPGIDLIGQVFNPLGERIGGEFAVNADFIANDERNADVAALTTSGFLAVYEDFEVANNTRSIRLTERDADGLNAVTVSIVVDASNNIHPTYFNPRVAVSSNTSALVVYEASEAGGDSLIAGVIYNPDTGAVGTVISVINVPGTNVTPSVAVLTNGNYVIAASTVDSGGDQVITYRLVGPTGANVLGVTRAASTDGDGENDRQAEVAALTGGGFVIVWTNTDASDTDIQAQRFNAAGTAQGGMIEVTLTGDADNAQEPAVAGLLDGGFIVLFDDDANGELRGKRYDAAGVFVGGEFVIATGGAGIDAIDAELLRDGRVAVSFTNAAGEVAMEVIDVRDTPNDPGVYSPNQWQIGTVGGDVFTADAGSEFVHGHDGADLITGGGQTRSYFGDAGDDRLIVTSPIDTDRYDGGAGTDTIDFSVSLLSNLTIDLDTGSVTDNVATEAVIGFENAIGSANADTITGNGGVNLLSGGAGNDTLDGEGGVDVLNGGDGDDVLIGSAADQAFGGEGDDTVINVFVENGVFDGGNGVDTLDLSQDTATGTYDLAAASFGTAFGGTFSGFENILGSGGAETMLGSAGANRLSGGGGNDILRGGGGADVLDGGLGVDVADFRDKTAAVSLTLLGAANAVARVGGVNEDTVRGVEHVYGGAAGDTLYGDAANNLLNGFGGNDVLRGGAGRDNLFGSVGVDTADYRDKAVSVAVTLNGATSVAVFVDGASEDALNNIEIVYGGSVADTLTGDSLANLFRGGGGADILDGGGGRDAVDFREKTTAVVLVLNGGTQATATVGGVADDRVSNIEDVYGGTANDILVGDGLANGLFGGSGADTLRGQAGADTLTGGAGADTFVYNNTAESTAAARDTLADFQPGSDKIKLNLIDADAGVAGDQAFVFGGAFTAGHLRVTAAGAGRWLVEGNTDADTDAELAILVVSPTAPAAADFLL